MRTGGESMSADGLGKHEILLKNLYSPANLNFVNGIFGLNNKKHAEESEMKPAFVTKSINSKNIEIFHNFEPFLSSAFYCI
jgi:hypothetical protein